MLLPGEIKPGSLEFLEEEDMDFQALQVLPQKTPAQTIRETKRKAERVFHEKAEQMLRDQENQELLKMSEK